MVQPNALRTWALRLAIGAWVLFSTAYGFPFLTALLDEWGAFKNPSEQFQSLVLKIAAFRDLITGPAAGLISVGLLGLASGFALGVWLDALARREGDHRRSTKPTDPIKKSGPAKAIEPREFLNLSVKYLTGLGENHTTAQAKMLQKPYMGKWLKISGSVHNIRPADSYVMMSIKETSGSTVYSMFALTWTDRLSLLPRGHEVTIVGKIEDIERGEVILEDCELISDRPVSNPMAGDTTDELLSH